MGILLLHGVASNQELMMAQYCEVRGASLYTKYSLSIYIFRDDTLCTYDSGATFSRQ